jgi:PAS domain S-box-containing protein
MGRKHVRLTLTISFDSGADAPSSLTTTLQEGLNLSTNLTLKQPVPQLGSVVAAALQGAVAPIPAFSAPATDIVVDAQIEARETTTETALLNPPLRATPPKLKQVISPTCRFVDVDKEWLVAMGYPIDELDRLSFLDLLSRDSQIRFMEQYIRLSAGKPVLGLELEMTTRTGKTLPIRADLQPELMGGKLLSVSCSLQVIQDITDLVNGIDHHTRQRQALLQQALEWLFSPAWTPQNGLQHTPLAVIDLKGKVVLARPDAGQQIGRPQASLHTDDSVFDWLGTSVCTPDEALKAQNDFQVGERHAATLGYAPASWEVLPLTEADGSPIGGLLALTVYTEEPLGGEYRTYDPTPETTPSYGVEAFASSAPANIGSQTPGLTKLVHEGPLAEFDAARQLQTLAQVATQTNTVVIITDPQGHIQWSNHGFEQISGYTLAEVVGRKPGHVLQGPQTDPATVQRIREHIAAQRPFTEEILNYHKDGHSYWLNLSVTPIFDSRGVLEHFIAIELDITQRREIEEELKQLSIVAAETDNAVIITSPEGLIQWVNVGFERISGYTLAEVVGRKPGHLLQGPDTNPETVQRIREHLAARRSFTEEILNYTKRGRPYWLSLHVTPVLNDDGSVAKFIAIESDITVQKSREEKLKQTNEELFNALEELRTAQVQLVQSEKMAALGQLMAGIAHEINTPISAIGSSSRLLSRDIPELFVQYPVLTDSIPQAQRPLFTELVGQALNHTENLTTKEERQLRRKVEQLLEEQDIQPAEEIAARLIEVRVYQNLERYLELFRLPNHELLLDFVHKVGRLKVNMSNISLGADKTGKIVYALKGYTHTTSEDVFEPVNIGDTIQLVLTLYTNQLKHGIQLEVDLEPVPPVHGNADELAQVWTNLLQNAMQAMEFKGQLAVRTRSEGGMVVVSFTDNGPGIPDEVKSKIFEPFFTTKKQGEGTGLGLDICRKIIEKHNGRIEVSSRPGETTFSVFLPAKA